MLQEAKEDLHEEVYIRFRTDGSMFNPAETPSPYKDTGRTHPRSAFCGPQSAHRGSPPGCFQPLCKATKAFGITISLKKTEVMFQKPPREVYTPPHIVIGGHQLNAVEHFTYLGSVIWKDATMAKDVDNRIAKASSSFGRLQKRVWQNHSLRLTTKIQVYKTAVLTTLLYGAEIWVLYR